MTLKIARRGQIPSFIAMDFLRAAARREAAGAQVCHLEIGQPSGGLPEDVLAELAGTLKASPMGYTIAQGIEPLRHALADQYDEVHGIKVDPEQILLTSGSSGGFVLSLLAAFEPGDRVGVTSPGYPAYRHMLTALGCEPVPIPVDADSGYRLSAAMIEAVDPPLEGLIIASPANPTGTVIPVSELRAIVNLCDARGIRLVSDEIYHGLTYGETATTVAGMSPNPIIVNSFSKFYCMTGWRLGWVVAPIELLRPMECLAQNLYISPPTLSQHAGLLALRHRKHFEDTRDIYARNRTLLTRALPELGITRFAPADGAFYIYADVSDITADSRTFCESMLAEIAVAATPGVDFDERNGSRFIRLSFCTGTAEIQEAVRRLREWL